MPLPTPYSYRTYLGDGTTDVFAVPFPYIVKAHVKVYVNWSVDDGLFDAELLDGVGFDWVGDTSINVTTAPTAPDTISVVRLTPVDQRVTQWQAGSPPTAFELTAADEQVLFVVQEFIDRVLATQGTLNFVISDGLTTVIDNLLSTSPTAALSANQGRILKGLIDALDTAVDAIIAGGGGGGGGGSVTVLDILTSTMTSAALSANMGRVLKELIDALDIRVDAAEVQNLINQKLLYETQAALGGTDRVAAGTIIWLRPPASPTTPPVGYTWTSGTERSRSAYPELFSAISTTYGAGDGTTTFNIPNESLLTNPYGDPTYRAYVKVGVTTATQGVIFTTSDALQANLSLTNGVYTSRAAPSPAIGFAANMTAMSPDARFMAFASVGATSLYIGSLDGSGLTGMTYGSIGSDTITFLAFTRDGEQLLLGTSAGIKVMIRTSGTAWSAATLIGGPVNASLIKPQPQGLGMIVAAPSGFTQLYYYLTLNGAGGGAYIGPIGAADRGNFFAQAAAAWHPGGTICALASNSGSGFRLVQTFARSDDTFSQLSGAGQPGPLSGDSKYQAIEFSNDGQFMVCAGYDSGDVGQGAELYSWDGSVFTKRTSALTTEGFTNVTILAVPGQPRMFFHPSTPSPAIYEVVGNNYQLRVALSGPAITNQWPSIGLLL